MKVSFSFLLLKERSQIQIVPVPRAVISGTLTALVQVCCGPLLDILAV